MEPLKGTDMHNQTIADDLTKVTELSAALDAELKADFPNAKLGKQHPSPKPNGADATPEPTLTAQLDHTIACLDGYIRVLKALKETL